MLMKSTTLTFALALALGTLTACAPASENNKYRAPAPPPFSKDTTTAAQMSTQADQVRVALAEISWMRQSASLSLNPPNANSQEGCVTRSPQKESTGTFLKETFVCTRRTDASDAATGQTVDLTGTQVYRTVATLLDVSGSFVLKSHSGVTTAQQGSLTRHLQTTLPTNRTDATVFNFTSLTTYEGSVAAQSAKLGEEWTADLRGGFMVSASQPLKLLNGSSILISDLPESDQTVKRVAQVAQLTATSDVTFELNGNCLRPIGTFALSVDTTQVGTLTAQASGYVLSTERDTFHAWGLRCLER